MGTDSIVERHRRSACAWAGSYAACAEAIHLFPILTIALTALLFKPLDEWGQFTVEFTKTRGFKAPDEFVVLIQHDKEAGLCRLVREPQDLTDRIEEMLAQGMLQKNIAAELKLSEAKVSRIVNQEIRPRQQEQAKIAA